MVVIRLATLWSRVHRAMAAHTHTSAGTVISAKAQRKRDGKRRASNQAAAFVYTPSPEPSMLSASQSAASKAAGASRRSCRRTFPHGGGAKGKRKTRITKNHDLESIPDEVAQPMFHRPRHGMPGIHMQQRSGSATHHRGHQKLPAAAAPYAELRLV